jgi:hypothetical protein
MIGIPNFMVPVMIIAILGGEVLGVFALVYFAARLAIRHERRNSI